MIAYGHFIGGKHVAGTSGRKSDVFQPMDGTVRGTVALALGYGSLYNHSYRPNARYDDIGQLTKIFTALRDIPPGEEITVNYNGDPSDRAAVAFEVVEEPELVVSRRSANGKN